MVDPWRSRCRTVVGIVLYIQSDEGLGDAIDDSHLVGGLRSHPEVLQTEKQRNVEESTGEPSKGSKLLSATNNLKDFFLDLKLERCFKLVTAKRKG
jgi:hypothetical protein